MMVSAAQNAWSGTIARYLPYRESYTAIGTDGVPLSLSAMSISITFSRCNSPVLSLSTDAGSVIVESLTNDAGLSVDSFRPDDVDVSALCGDYTGDIVMTDVSGVAQYLASGTITFTEQPI